MLYFHIKTALRSIRRKKFFSILNISGLAIGWCIFIFSLEYFGFENGFNNFHSQLTDIYRVNVAAADGKSAITVPTIAPMLTKNIAGIQYAVRIADNFNNGAIVTILPQESAGKEITFREENAVYADDHFFDVFSFPLLEGSKSLDKPNTVIITAATSKKYFGKENAMGRIIRLHNQFGSTPYEITGIAYDVPVQSDVRFDFLFSLQTLANPANLNGETWAQLDSWNVNAFNTFVLLDNNIDPQAIAAIASSSMAKENPAYKMEDGTLQLQPLNEIHLGKSLKDDNPTSGVLTTVYFILGLGMLLLLIAWINYINFSTAFALSQAKDIGIHRMIGSERKQIVFRYVLESIFLNVGAFLIALLLAAVLQPLFNYATDKPLSLGFINNPSIWWLCITIPVLGILLSGGYVGWILSRFKPISMVKLNSGSSDSGTYLRKGLVTFQFVTSIVFISSTIIAFQQLNFMKQYNLGMNIDKLLVVNGPSIKQEDEKDKASVFINQLAMLPFIEKSSCTGSVPGIGYAHNFSLNEVTSLHPLKGDENKTYDFSLVDENYFNVYQIPLVSGRSFTSAEADKAFNGDKIMVNETAAKELGFNPLQTTGEYVKWNTQWEIVGVVKDYHHRSIKERVEPIIYIPQHNNQYFTLQFTDGDFGRKMAAVRQIYEASYPGNPFEFHFLKETYDQQYADQQRTGTIAMSLSCLVIMISCLGLIGLSVFTSRRRTKEIGVRKVLGASVTSIVNLLSKEFLLLVFIAFVIATPLAWWTMNKWLEDFAYRITINWWVFVLAGCSALIITLLTVSIQSVKSAIANPVKSLRTE
ncbi:MAG: ABC transporter permease [Chitinophagales bacterium]